MADKALLRPTTKAKLTGEKRPKDSTEDKYYSYHKSASHSDEECKAQGSSNKKPKTSKGALAEVKPGKGKKAAGKQPSKQATKPHPPKTDETSAAQVKSLQAKLEALEKSATSSKKIQVLKTKVGEYIHYLNHYTDNELLNENPVYLDSGASKHVAPVELALDNVTEVTTPHFLIDATNNQSPIQMQGDLAHNSGGKKTIFSDVLQCNKLTDTLISCSKWLHGTDDRIILTSSNAYYQAAGESTLHQIAKVISGMYYMGPP
ncbi:hypothetical protein HDU81_001148 [Chytriomyces hyalinus]|nr:hypothetical protein HDU81_001148 [Chytriomyces hyalinus]